MCVKGIVKEDVNDLNPLAPTPEASDRRPEVEMQGRSRWLTHVRAAPPQKSVIQCDPLVLEAAGWSAPRVDYWTPRATPSCLCQTQGAHCDIKS